MTRLMAYMGKCILYFFQSVSAIDSHIAARRRACAERRLTLQPHIVAVAADGGRPSLYVLKVEHISFQFKNVLRAVDSAIKLHFALDIKYQFECSQIWTLIQVKMFGIVTKSDNVSNKMRVLCNELQF